MLRLFPKVQLSPLFHAIWDMDKELWGGTKHISSTDCASGQTRHMVQPFPEHVCIGSLAGQFLLHFYSLADTKRMVGSLSTCVLFSAVGQTGQ